MIEITKKYKHTRTFAHTQQNKTYGYIEGVVFTPFGIVHVISQGIADGRDLTTVKFVKDEQMYTHESYKKYKETGLAVLAGKFIRQVYESQYESEIA